MPWVPEQKGLSVFMLRKNSWDKYEFGGTLWQML
jgi:hypothetical protein